MGSVRQVEVPPDSLLAEFGGPGDYRDCFTREVAGEVTLEQFIERFYSSAAFLPERIVLGLLGRGASREDIRALARGEAESFAVWEVVERRSGLVAEHGERSASRKGDRPPAGPEGRGNRSADALRNTKTQPDEILLHSKDTNTASWLAVEPTPTGTRLLFGSWVGNLEQSAWRFMQRPHQWYSRVLLKLVRP